MSVATPSNMETEERREAGEPSAKMSMVLVANSLQLAAANSRQNRELILSQEQDIRQVNIIFDVYEGDENYMTTFNQYVERFKGVRDPSRNDLTTFFPNEVFDNSFTFFYYRDSLRFSLQYGDLFTRDGQAVTHEIRKARVVSTFGTAREHDMPISKFNAWFRGTIESKSITSSRDNKAFPSYMFINNDFSPRKNFSHPDADIDCNDMLAVIFLKNRGDRTSFLSHSKSDGKRRCATLTSLSDAVTKHEIIVELTKFSIKNTSKGFILSAHLRRVVPFDYFCDEYTGEQNN